MRCRDAALLMLIAAASSCRKVERGAERGHAREAVGVAEVRSIDVAKTAVEPPQTRTIGSYPPVLVARGANVPIVYLHGMCSEPRPDVDAWGADVRLRGTVVALYGDVPCESKPSTSSWSVDVDALHQRIQSTLDALSESIPLAKDRVVLVGESMGASRVVALAQRFGASYPRIVWVGGPTPFSPSDVAPSVRTALVAAEHENLTPLRRTEEQWAATGRARSFVLPDATHGTYGAHGGRVLASAIDFVTEAP